MIEINVKIQSANDAIHIVKKATLLENDIDFTNGRLLVDAKSLIGVLSSDFSKPCKLIILTNEIDENVQHFIDAIKNSILSVEVKR